MEDIGRQAISKEELYTAAVGERAARYYVPKFLAFEEGTKRFSFNVWALLFGAFWFCYRRMRISAAWDSASPACARNSSTTPMP